MKLSVSLSDWLRDPLVSLRDGSSSAERFDNVSERQIRENLDGSVKLS